MDFLFSLGQVVCIIGLLYGAYLSLTCLKYVGRDALRQTAAGAPPLEPTPPSEPRFCYDQLTSHMETRPHSRIVANDRGAARTLRAP